jgi:beta-galactosidase
MRALPALLLIAACNRVAPAPPAPPADLRFPEGFLFGTATAGFQIEMGCPTLPAGECNDPNSDWFQWVSDPELIAEAGNFLSGEPITNSPGSFELFAEDSRLAAEFLGANAQRMGVEWSRLFPVEPVGAATVDELAAFADAGAVAHYHAVFQDLRQKGLSPLITLNHYTLPLWLHDGKACHRDIAGCTRRGWLDRDRILAEIALYAGFVGREFGGEIDRWATLNEPTAVILSGYMIPGEDRTNPPGVSNPALAKQVLVTMIEAHARMYDAVHAEDLADADGDGVAAEVGLVHNLADMLPSNPNSEADVLGAEHADYIFNRVFLNGTILGQLDPDLDGVPDAPRADLAGRMDYLGVNYYTQGIITGLGGPLIPDIPLFDFIPEIPFDNFPQGLYDVMMLASEYGRPIIITENGTTDVEGDRAGPEFFVPHLEALLAAIRDGADVRGYLYWSLLDNYEWNHGTSFRFGLFAVDPQDPLKRRTPKRGAAVFREIARFGGLPSSVRAEFGQGDF